jgi:hypothetical protein
VTPAWPGSARVKPLGPTLRVAIDNFGGAPDTPASRMPRWKAAPPGSDSNVDSNRAGTKTTSRGGDGRPSDFTAADGRRRTSRPRLTSEGSLRSTIFTARALRP